MWINHLTHIYFMKTAFILLKKEMNFWRKKQWPLIKNYHPQFITPHTFLIRTWHHFLIILMTFRYYHQTELPANQHQYKYPGLLFFHVNLLFVQHLFQHMLVFLLSLLLLYVTVKTSLIVLYVVILSVRVVVMLIELVNLITLLLVHLIALQISVSLLNSLPVIHILLIPVNLLSVLLVIVIFTVNVSCVKV